MAKSAMNGFIGRLGSPTGCVQQPLSIEGCLSFVACYFVTGDDYIVCAGFTR
jgi:hypothetical protein